MKGIMDKLPEHAGERCQALAPTPCRKKKTLEEFGGESVKHHKKEEKRP